MSIPRFQYAAMERCRVDHPKTCSQNEMELGEGEYSYVQPTTLVICVGAQRILPTLHPRRWSYDAASPEHGNRGLDGPD